MPSYVLVWLLLILAWAANFVIRIGFSALLPSIIDELQLSYTRAGLLASAFFYAYVIMQIPSGLLGDRWGRRRILVLGLLGGALSAGLTGLAGSFATLFAARALTGAFQGSLFSNDRAIVATVTPPARIGLGQGVSFSGPGLGLTFGLVIGGLLVEVLPWRTVMMLFGLGPVMAAVLIVRYVPALASWPGSPASRCRCSPWPRSSVSDRSRGWPSCCSWPPSSAGRSGARSTRSWAV